MIAKHIEMLKNVVGEKYYSNISENIFKKISEVYPGISIDKALEIAEINIQAVIDLSGVNFKVYDKNTQLKELLKWNSDSDYDLLIIKDIKELKKLYIE